MLERSVWGRPLEGLLVTAALALAVALTLDLSRIATLGSAGFLLIFAGVNFANARLRSVTGASRSLPQLPA